MYIDTVPNRGSRPAILLREGWREDKRVKKRTLANLTDWPAAKVETLRRLLRDEPLMAPGDAFAIERSLPHGHAEAVLAMMSKLDLGTLIAAKRCRERDLVVAMIAERLIEPASKLATTRLWQTTSLAEELGVDDAGVDELYQAMDWLLERQPAIEAKLAKRHLAEGGLVLYDVTSSFYEGRTCPLTRFGYSRDGRRDKPQVVYGVLTDGEGRPVAAEAYPGNTGDPTTVPDQVGKLQQRFGLKRVVLVGDRGLLTGTQIEALKKHPGVGWISALRARAIRSLADSGALQMSLFDEQTLAEIKSPAFPGERLVVCYNPLLADQRRRKRTELLAAAERALDKIVRAVERRTRTPLDRAEIGKRVGAALRRGKMAKHFKVEIADGALSYRRREDTIQREAELDGIYVIRTSEPAARLSPENAVRGYKSLAQVERAFRSLKGLDILVRPIHHTLEKRVRAHIFLCLLAYYVEWHLRQAWQQLLFADEELARKRPRRDPVAPPEPSDAVKAKKSTLHTPDALPVHSFATLLAELATRCRNRCRLKALPNAPAFTQLTEPTPLQQRAFDLIAAFPMHCHVYVKGTSASRA